MQEVLEEIEGERQKQREEFQVEGEENDSGIVLVACKDERSCMQLEECILNSTQKVFPTFSSYVLDFLVFFSVIIFTLYHACL